MTLYGFLTAKPGTTIHNLKPISATSTISERMTCSRLVHFGEHSYVWPRMVWRDNKAEVGEYNR